MTDRRQQIADALRNRDGNAGHARALPESWDPEARTIDVKLTTSAPVRRRTWFGEFDEILVMEPGAVRMGRINSGGPFILQHASYNANSLLGSFVAGSARIEGNELWATVRFVSEETATAREVEPYIQEIVEGHRSKVSIGYQIHKFEVIEADSKGEPDTVRVTDWEPLEGSSVVIPADDAAGYRSHGTPEHTTAEPSPQMREFVERMERAAAALTAASEHPNTEPQAERSAATQEQGESPMSEQTQPTNAAEPVATVTEAQRQEIARAERARCEAIRSAAKHLNLTDEKATATVRQLIDEGKTEHEARAALHQMAAERADAQPTSPLNSVEVGKGEREVFAEAVEAVLLHRGKPGRYGLPEGAAGEKARNLRGFSLKELAREHLRMNGHAIYGGAAAIAERAFASRSGMHGASDFPQILANVAGKSLLNSYMESNHLNYRQFCTPATLSDLKEVKRVRLSAAPTPSRVLAGGEYQNVELSDTAEGYQLLKYGEIIAIDEETIINDDLAAFTRTPQLMGIAFARLEGNLIWSNILVDNPTMGEDSVALFHADHGNLSGADAAPGINTIGAALAAMAQQTGLNGEAIQVAGRFVLVPQTQRLATEQAIGQLSGESDTPGNRTPGYMQGLVVIPEARLDAANTTRFYVVADPSEVDTIEYGFLEGQEGVQISTRNGFDVDGLQVKAKLYFGAKAIDYRGLYKYGAA